LPSSSFKQGSSEWWIERLSKALAMRQRRFDLLEAYYRGTQRLSDLASQAWRESDVSRMFPNFLSANHSKLIVNAAAGRLVVLGFRLGMDEPDADDEAARIWGENEMEAESEKAIIESLVKGECPVLIEPNPRDPATPIITAQQPNNVIVWTPAGDRRIRLAALKTWWDDDARRRLYILYFPDHIEYWQDRQPNQMDWFMNQLFATTPAQWERRTPAGKSSWWERNPLGEVPVVLLPNDPRLAGSPEGEHEAVLSRIDHYNKTLMDMAVTSHELAYPQRYASGVDGPADEVAVDATGTVAPAPRSGVQTGQNRWITVPSPDATFGQFAAATLDQYVKALDQIRADIATDSFTPYHFLLNMPTSVPPSGESITAAETALVDKCEGHQRDKGMGWRNAMRLAFLMTGDEERAQAMRHGEVIWGDAERRTESQHVDALSKLAADPIGVPQQAIWERIPATPHEIRRWRRMKTAETLAAPDAAATDEPGDEPVGTNEPNGLDNSNPGGAT
jgi:hypothetical protein